MQIQVPNYDIILDFIQLDLIFNKEIIEDKFQHYNASTLGEATQKDKYLHLANDVINNYGNNLNLPLGEFLITLKNANNPFYQQFLNPYGDQIYSKYRLRERNFLKGLYIYCVGKEKKYLGRCTDAFYKRVDTGYGNISPKNCYLDGQSTNCRINSLVTQNRDNISFWICPMDDINQIKEYERLLIVANQYPWNIQNA